jgi:hypothetical protein
MHLDAGEIRRVHEAFDPPTDLIEQRRAVYRIAIHLLSDSSSGDASADVLDNPLVRGRLGEALTGAANFGVDCLHPVDELVADGYSTEVDGFEVRLASAAVAALALRPVLRRVADELSRHGDESWTPTVLVTDDERTAKAWRTLVAGIRLAVQVAPDLARDLLPHVALFAVCAREASDRLGSASAREYPGLVLLPEPESALEVAEALIHEGVHQKFFDLALTKTIFGEGTRAAPRFRPSWAPPEAPDWPIEQAFAAFHAYVCLGVFGAAGRGTFGHELVRHPHSLLPAAEGRAAEIGEWLLDRGSFLGPHGHLLLERLLGRTPAEIPASQISRLDRRLFEGAEVAHCGSRTLIGRRGDSVELYWIDATSAISALDRPGLVAVDQPLGDR